MAKDMFTGKWILENSLEIIDRYEKGMLTLRALHYQLVSIGMTNSLRHYKRVVNTMIQARWDDKVSFDTFSDHDRGMIGQTDYDFTLLEDEIIKGKKQINAWMNSYYKNRWENQEYYPEVFIEKKALQGVFESICISNRVTLGACKGYPSLTFLNEATERFKEAVLRGKKPVILYFGDYDPSGEDIPRSIEENIIKLGCNQIEVKRFALMQHQVIEWNLPPAPAKEGDSRTKNWDGIGQVELDAIEPRKLQRMCQNAINEFFDYDLLDELNEIEERERVEYKKEMINFVNGLNI
ncbi:MAG: hypothetical protein VB046_06785 [Paludibacter sp.]|nr:hypothetical protein [Paludibacter sp.]